MKVFKQNNKKAEQLPPLCSVEHNYGHTIDLLEVVFLFLLFQDLITVTKQKIHLIAVTKKNSNCRIANAKKIDFSFDLSRG